MEQIFHTKLELGAWHNVLLTSAGFEDLSGRQKTNIVRRFHKMLQIPPHAAKVLFIPTAAIDKESRFYAAKCHRELLHAGIPEENITTYELAPEFPEQAGLQYDVLYFTGGDTRHLHRRIRETDFAHVIYSMVSSNKVYVGVSAGSIVTTPHIGEPFGTATEGLNLIRAYLSVHQPEGTTPRTDLPLPHIPLTDKQALAVSHTGYELLEN